MKSKGNLDIKVIFAITWLVFTVTLALWWIRLGLDYVGAKRTMILSEGITLIVFLIIGGASLIYFIYAERKQRKQLEAFFASTNHEIKTYLASLRLRAEGLASDLTQEEDITCANKMVADTVRLEMQIENSLIFSTHHNGQLFYEEIDLPQYFNGLNESWININILVTGLGKVKIDRRLFSTITKNIIHNTLVHGQASEVTVAIEQKPGHTSLTFHNNGRVFSGDFSKLGQLFYRHNSNSRSGIGLYLVSELTKKQGGQVQFKLGANQELETILSFPRGAAHG